MRKAIRIAVVDDHPMVRRGVIDTVADERDIDVVGEGATADEAVKLCEELRPDLLVLDVTLPGNGLEALSRITADCPQTVVVMMSIREDLTTVRSALRAGAHAYVSKGIGGNELVATFRRVMAGERFISPDLAVRLLTEPETLVNANALSHPEPTLTKREAELFELLSQGLNNLAIATKLGLSENTIKHYLTQLFRKLGVRNRTEAAIAARDHRRQ
jgi:two-component system, NarL family, nitrate/nitrite response regulator NarL